MITVPLVKLSIDGGSTQGEGKVSRLPYYRIEGEDGRRPVVELGSAARQLVAAAS
jgi:hypothetical protein